MGFLWRVGGDTLGRDRDRDRRVTELVVNGLRATGG